MYSNSRQFAFPLTFPFEFPLTVPLKLSLRLLLSLVAGAVGAATQAADQDLLDTLLENGAITAEQHAELSAERLPETADRPSAAPDGARVTVGSDGVEIVSEDGEFALEIGGRLHADWARHEGEGPIAAALDGTDVRRARLRLAGRLHEVWSWSAETDFAGNRTSLKDWWLGYEGFGNVMLMAGHQKQPYNLSLEMSSNDIPFIERGIDNALVAPFVDRAVGVRAETSGERWFAAGGVFGESIDAFDGWGTSGRLVFAPVLEDERVVHVGLRAAYREPDTDRVIRIRAETTAFSSLYLIDTGELPQVNDVTLLGPEAAVAVGPFSLTGEYSRASIDLPTADLDFDSWHVAATWTLGGESRAAAYRIDAGEFKRLSAARPFSLGAGGGTWELAARVAALDLNDGVVTGGRERTFTLGANWYANSNIRLMLDWTHVLDTDGSTPLRAAAESLDVLALRAQYAF